MKTSTVATDRLAVTVVGLGVLALGATGAAWQLGRLPVPPDTTLHIRNVDAIVAAPWWPYALGVAAVLLAALGLRWLYAHRPGQSVGTAILPNSSSTGQLTLDVNTAASAAASALAHHPHVASASGTSRIDRGERIVELDVKLGTDPGALAAVTAAVEEINRDLGHALSGVPFRSRILLHAPRNAGGSSRVA